MTRVAPVAPVATAFCLMSLAAFAQPAWTPSADDLIRQLRPQSGGATRGIRPLSGAAAPDAAAPEPVRPAMSHGGAPRPPHQATHVAQLQPAPVDPQGTASLTVQFENGSDRLTPAATHTLDELGRALSNPELAQYSFHIVGHTDTVGRPDANRTLSERRAAAVSDYIATRYNVDRARLVALGKGQDEPLVPTALGVPEPRNRRVQIVNVGS